MWTNFGNMKQEYKTCVSQNICDTIKISTIFIQVWINKEYQSIPLLWSNACGVNFIIFKDKKASISAYV